MGPADALEFAFPLDMALVLALALALGLTAVAVFFFFLLDFFAITAGEPTAQDIS